MMRNYLLEVTAIIVLLGVCALVILAYVELYRLMF